MSCYFRHMKDTLSQACIKVAPQNKKAVDQAYHQIVEVEYGNCSPAWKKLKEVFFSNEPKKQQVINKLKESMKYSL